MVDFFSSQLLNLVRYGPGVWIWLLDHSPILRGLLGWGWINWWRQATQDLFLWVHVQNNLCCVLLSFFLFISPHFSLMTCRQLKQLTSISSCKHPVLTSLSCDKYASEKVRVSKISVEEQAWSLALLNAVDHLLNRSSIGLSLTGGKWGKPSCCLTGLI